MSVTAKCHNYTGCLLAYRGEEIQLAAGAPLVCTECGKPVTPVQGGAGKLMKWIILGVVLLALAGGVGAALLVAKKKFLDKPATPTPAATPSPTPARLIPQTTPPLSKVPIVPNIPSVPSTPNVPKITPAVPSAPVEPPKVVKEVNTSLDKDENKRVREDVLKRIDVMPITATNKDKLYNSVQRARGMGMVLQIPFGSGKVDLSANEVAALKAALEDPKIIRIRDDPTAVFVVLGYADSKGDDKKNVSVSQKRADAVVAAMRDKAGVLNVTHAVAMGGSTLHSAESLEKNRIAEVWAVLP